MKLLDANLDVKLKALRKNPYFDDLSEERPKELERSGVIRTEDRRIHIGDDTVLRQWSQPN